MEQQLRIVYNMNSLISHPLTEERLSSMDSLVVLDVAFGATALYLVYRIITNSLDRKSHPLPPGPKALPLIGNLFDMPTGSEPPAEHWARHEPLYGAIAPHPLSKLYNSNSLGSAGPISSVSVLGTTFIILNDAQLAIDMLDKKSLIYSSRPVIPFSGEM